MKIIFGMFKKPSNFHGAGQKAQMNRDKKPPPKKWTDHSLGTHGFLQLKEVKLHYVANGDEYKPLMLLLHGFPECWYSWRHQLKEFRKSYRVVAIDQRGYSLSDKPKGRRHYTKEKLSSDVAEVIEALGYNECVLVGHDWGAIIAWVTAERFPEKVSNLIIMNCPHPVVFQEHLFTNFSQVRKSWYIFYFQIPYLPEYVLAKNDFEALSNMFTSKAGVRKENMDPEDIEIYKYVFAQKGALTGAINYYRASVYEKPLQPPKDSLKMPVLIIWGSKDIYLEKEMADACGKFVSNLSVKYVDNATHFVQLDQPDVVNNLMWQFLK